MRCCGRSRRSKGSASTLGDSVVDVALAPLRQRLAVADPASMRPCDAAAERKIVTVLFVDVVGFTDLSERIGSEATREVMNGLFDSLVPIVERFGGVVDKFIGDEIMAVFGAPRAVERHAEHALRAALAMYAALDEYNRARRLSLALHAGANTGEVIAGKVGSQGRHEYSVTGDTVNVAARLEGAAAAGEVVVGPSTFRHTFQFFEFEALEPLALKGKARPLAAYRLIGPARAPGRVRSDGLRLPFCGRGEALDALLSRIDTNGSGPRGAVFLRAPPGLGKSRLVFEFRERLRRDVRWLESSGEAYRSDMSYGVVQGLLDALVGLSDGAPGEEAARVYLEYLNGIGSQRARQAPPYLFRLRGLPVEASDDATIAMLSADALRQRLTSAVGRIACGGDRRSPDRGLYRGRALGRPLLDRGFCARWPRTAALTHLLFVLTTRPDASAASPWIDAVASVDDGLRIVDLPPLSEQDSRDLLDQALGGGSVPALVARIGAKAQGNPLYMTAFLRSLVDSGVATIASGRVTISGQVADLAVPDTLHAVIGSQIDRLPAHAKSVLHWASIFGNVFAVRDVARMAEVAGVAHDIDAALSLLRERQLVEPEGDDRLRFVHAWSATLPTTRCSSASVARLHGAAADVMEEQLDRTTEPSEGEVAALAWHRERAGDHARASPRYEQAAALASSSHAHAEEFRYLESAIRLADAGDKRRLARLTERAGDTLKLLARYSDAAQRFELPSRSTDASAALDMARLHRKIARTFTPRFSAEEANRAIDEARRWIRASSDPTADAWWREHFAVELYAMIALYMQGRTEDCADIADVARAADRRPCHACRERGLFHRDVVLLRLRQQRYRPDVATVELAALSTAELLEAGDVEDLCLTLFGRAFTLLWHGAVEEADRALQHVLRETVRLADAERNLLCLVYLAVSSRQLGNVDTADAFAQAAIARAQANRSVHYEGVTQGTLAWVAWRRGDGALADRRVELAQQSTIPNYPFAWIYGSRRARARARAGRSHGSVCVRRTDDRAVAAAARRRRQGCVRRGG